MFGYDLAMSKKVYIPAVSESAVHGRTEVGGRHKSGAGDLRPFARRSTR
jgi:hypothetical protein